VFAGSRRIACRRAIGCVKRIDPKAACNALPPKPKGMHWSTYDRLAERYDIYDSMWSMAVMRWLGNRRR